jgi:MFS superfamily sulfate permease-like transporter
MSVTFLCGMLLLGMGFLNLGFIIRFISRPVLAGFASASAIITIASSIGGVIGVSVPRSQARQMTGAAASLCVWCYIWSSVCR